MEYLKIIKKFSKAYDVLGHYIFESSRLITIWERDKTTHDLLRKNIKKLDTEGEIIFDEEDQNYGAIITALSEIDATYIIVLEAKRIKSVGNHWKRIQKAVFKTLPFEELLAKTSIESKILELKEQYLKNLQLIQDAYQTIGE